MNRLAASEDERAGADDPQMFLPRAGKARGGRRGKGVLVGRPGWGHHKPTEHAVAESDPVIWPAS
jgi:hypothetical protein